MKKNYTSFLIALALTAFMGACGGETETSEPEQAVNQTVSTEAPEAKLNVNTASDEAFRTIPGVGDNMVYEFKEYRPYVSIREFRQEIGKYVDEAQVAEYEKYIFVPISFNESDAATLQQIPGLSASEADELTANRPFESRQSFADALSSYINEQQMETAMTYLENE